MKRVFVPTALHAELTEYTNLVRVLRTTRTLDLTAHLLHHAAQYKDNEADTWTSWPLIDCTVPEWSFEDEIRQLGETVVRARDGDDDELDSDSDLDLDGLSPAAENRLVFHSGAVLVHILNLLADQRPAASGSMQNRLWPMNWEDVISLLAVSGVVHPTYVLFHHRTTATHVPSLSIVARAEKRIERIYGPSTTKGKPSFRS
ncbi:hypothetical protein JVT61DRAFT_3548 [Boletus reticuloceps]|uniref:Uncharacterized protein n=1 Tax=Boletus reticuloceps TaxID=495285 RepID=A0A8I3AA40_9AGAM|nr:hypothetical protein JVT61DRAFT_3548 [Boletus reticuloceps]